MADDIDRAAAITDLFLAKALQHREPTKRAKGSCYNCGDPLPQTRLLKFLLALFKCISVIQYPVSLSSNFYANGSFLT